MCMTSCSSRILSRNQKVIQTFISKNLTLIESLTFIVFASSNGLTKKINKEQFIAFVWFLFVAGYCTFWACHKSDKIFNLYINRLVEQKKNSFWIIYDVCVPDY